jgi:hypothetical protein
MSHTPKTLCVLPAGRTLHINYEALLPADGGKGILRMIGRRKDPTLNEGAGGWRPTGQPETVPNTHEYRYALKVGDLEPGDEATARYMGLTFSPPDVHVQEEKESA